MAALALERHVKGERASGRVVAGVAVACRDIDANTDRVTPVTTLPHRRMEWGYVYLFTLHAIQEAPG